jgi:hypothetical protein
MVLRQSTLIRRQNGDSIEPNSHIRYCVLIKINTCDET